MQFTNRKGNGTYALVVRRCAGAKLDPSFESGATNLKLDELNRPGVQLAGASVTCPCIWKTEGTEARPLAIPKYNNENRWYVQKYQTIVSAFEARDRAVGSARSN